MDILEILRTITKDWELPPTTVQVSGATIVLAIGEIERLRALAGAVSPGPSLRDIRDSKTTGC